MNIEEEIEEINDWLDENAISRALLKKSNLKRKELQALLLYFRDEEISFTDLSSELGINRSGAWKRWKKGYDKIIESFFTLELAVYGGILEPEATKHFVEDLRDYLKLAHREGDKEAIRKRLERRMAQMEKKRR